MLLSCKTHSSNKPEEYLQVHRTSYRVVNNEAIVQVSVSDNVWYQDSVGITQLSGIGVGQSASRDSLYVIPLGYRFVDMRRKWVYEYRNLSDTAEIVQKYGNADRMSLTGGWGFNRKSVIKFDSLRAMGDTTINGIEYQKHRYIQDFQGTKLLGETLSRCDRKGTIFHLDVGLSKATGCPVVKGTSWTRDRRFISSSVEIEFVSNLFPDSVKHAFEAWKRNVELYPVQ